MYFEGFVNKSNGNMVISMRYNIAIIDDDDGYLDIHIRSESVSFVL